MLKLVGWTCGMGSLAIELVERCDRFDVSSQNVLIEIPWSLLQVVFSMLSCTYAEDIVQLFERKIL